MFLKIRLTNLLLNNTKIVVLMSLFSPDISPTVIKETKMSKT